MEVMASVQNASEKHNILPPVEKEIYFLLDLYLESIDFRESRRKEVCADLLINEK